MPRKLWRSFRERVVTAAHMSWWARREFALVLLLSLAAEVSLRTMRITRTASLFGVRFAAAPSAAEGMGEVLDELPAWAWRRLRVVAAVMRRWPVDGTCLRQSLVAGQRLRSLRPVLKLGVAATAGGVQAHAWLEIAGRSLDPSSVLYDELPAARR